MSSTLALALLQLPGVETPEMTFMDIWEGGGWMMWPLAACAVIGLIVIVWKMIDLSTKASRTNHPASLALFPVERVEKPATVKNETGQPTLAIPFGEITLGIVVEGTGEI